MVYNILPLTHVALPQPGIRNPEAGTEADRRYLADCMQISRDLQKLPWT